MNIRQKTLAAILCLGLIFSSHPLFSQEPPIQVFTPNAAELGKYGRIPVSYYNGLPVIDIPLTELHAKNYVLPIHLSYHASGVKPDDHPGWVGLGWSLHAGGCINRIVNGVNDDMDSSENNHYGGTMSPLHPPGYLYNCTSIQNNDWENPDTLEYYYGASQYDTAADEFQVCIDDINASFYVSGYDRQTGEAQIKIISRDPVCFKAKIILSGTQQRKVLYSSNMPDDYYSAWHFSHISSIILTKDNGVVYTFGGDDNAIEYSYQILRTNYSERLDARTVTNTWHLKSIHFPWGEEIYFEYKKDGHPIYKRDVHTLTNIIDMGVSAGVPDNQSEGNTKAPINSNKYLNVSYTVLEPAYLTSISSKLTCDTLHFTSTKSTELAPSINYDEFNKRFISVSETTQGNTLSYSDFLSYSYYMKLDALVGKREIINFGYSNTNNQRLTLQALAKRAPGTIQIDNRYFFQYNTETDLPNYNAKCNDCWGYYNGKYYGIYPGYQGLESFRTVDPSKITAGILTGITWPTGGSTVFTYEPNEYASIRTPYQETAQIHEHGYAGGVRIKRITNYDTDGTALSTRLFTYVNDNEESSGVLSAKPLYYKFYWRYNDFWIQNSALMTSILTTYSIGREEWLNEIPLTLGSHVTYDRVIETLSSGDVNEYVYTNFSDYPDIKPEYAWTNFNEWSFGDPLHSLEIGRGQLKDRISYNPSGDIVYSEHNSYNEDYSDYLEFPQRSFFANTYLSRLTATRLYSFFPYLSSRSINRYPEDSSLAPINETETFRYDTHRNRIYYERTQGEHYEADSLTFSGHYNGGVYHDMQNANHFDKAVEHLSIRDGVVIGSELTIWKHNEKNDDFVISSQYQYNLSSPTQVFYAYDGSNINTQYEQTCWFPQYDAYSNPLQFRPHNAPCEVYRWATDHSGVSAIFKGVTDRYDVSVETEQSINGSILIEPNRHESLEFTCNTGFTMQLLLLSAVGQNWCVLLKIDNQYISLANINSNYLDSPWNQYQEYYPSSTSVEISPGTHVISVVNTIVYNSTSLPSMTGITLNYNDLRTTTEYLGVENVLFEDFEKSGNYIGVGFNSKNSWMGPYSVYLDGGTGKYIIDYNVYKNNTWEFVQKVFSGNSYTVNEGEKPIDNIRVYPAYGLAKSFSYYPLIGLRSWTDSRGITESFEYDGMGRLIAVKNTQDDITTTYTYSFTTSPSNTGQRPNEIKICEFTAPQNSSPIQRHLYYNGFGENTQVVIEDTDNEKDIIFLQEYDNESRPFRQWLPVSRNGNSGETMSVTSYKLLSQSYYADLRPFKETLYNNALLNQKQVVSGPGQAWHEGGHDIVTTTLANTSSGPLVYKGYQYATIGNYPVLVSREASAASTMQVIRQVDEDGRISLDFIDEFGQTVLHRQFSNTDSLYIDTHYIYDWKGRLQCVLPPTLSASLKESNASIWNLAYYQPFSQLAYYYSYDGRNRMISRKLPGCQVEYFIYDKNDRLVYSQDGGLRAQGKWRYFLKDPLWRDCMTGTVTASLNYYTFPLSQISVIALPTWITGVGSNYGYTVVGISLPSASIPDRVWFYDSYAPLTSLYGILYAPTENNVTAYATTYSTSTQGLLTGEINRVYNNENEITRLPRVIFYDWKGRISIERELVHPDGTMMQRRYAYGFRDEILLEQNSYYNSAGLNSTEQYRHTYNLMGQKTGTFHLLGNMGEKSLIHLGYDSFGRVSESTIGNNAPMLTSAYSYNIRSWLTAIDSPLFTETLQYYDNNLGSNSQWGGNIARMQWRSGLNAANTSYLFTYDKLSRLTTALYNGSFSNIYSRGYQYDANGNLSAIAVGNLGVQTFNLSGNQISGDTYDAKGRLVTSPSDNIASITYNELDLPARIVFDDGKSIRNTYLADGTKLQTRLCSLGDTLTLDYKGNNIFKNQQLHSVITNNGFIEFSGNLPQYRYFLKDHLGNNRIVADENGNTLQINNFDPYGNALSTSSSLSSYKYGGKELIWNGTLSWYDFLARTYNPSKARFTTLDPFSESSFSISPYAYCNNNPLRLIDPFGLTNFIVNGERRFIDDGYDDTISLGTAEFSHLFSLFVRGSGDYLPQRQNYMDLYGFIMPDGNYSIAAASIIAKPSSHKKNLATLGGMLTSATTTAVSGIAELKYNELLGTWIGRNGKVYPMSTTGNQYTGGKIKYAKALSSRLKTASRLCGEIGLIHDIYRFVKLDDANPIEKNLVILDSAVDIMGFIPHIGWVCPIIWNFGVRTELEHWMYSRQNDNVTLSPSSYFIQQGNDE